MQKQQLYDQIPTVLTRETPVILTQFHLTKNQQLLEKNIFKFDYHISSNNFIQPYGLYLILKESPTCTHIIKEDLRMSFRLKNVLTDGRLKNFC